MENNEKMFNVTGLPSNDPFEIEVPDEKRRAVNRSSKNAGISALLMEGLSNLTPEKMMKMIPPDQLEEIKAEAEAQGEDINDLFKEAIDVLNTAANGSNRGNSFDSLLTEIDNVLNDLFGVGIDDVNRDNSSEEETEEEEISYPLGTTDYLHPELFGETIAVSSETLYDEFLEKFGTDGSKYLDNDKGITEFEYTDFTVKLNAIPIKELKYITSTDKFIVFYAEPEDETKYGYFTAVVKDDKGQFTMFIPEFGNTFKVNGDGSVGLYSPTADKLLFEKNSNGDFTFLMLNMNTLLFSIQYQLAPYKSVILNPKKFGTIKNVIAPVYKPSSMLKVGNIVSNESPEAVLLKKDADLPLEETVFPLYFNFGTVISEASLKIIQQILSKVDFNKLKLLDYCELKWTSDHRLYVDIDLGDF